MTQPTTGLAAVIAAIEPAAREALRTLTLSDAESFDAGEAFQQVATPEAVSQLLSAAKLAQELTVLLGEEPVGRVKALIDEEQRLEERVCEAAGGADCLDTAFQYFAVLRKRKDELFEENARLRERVAELEKRPRSLLREAVVVTAPSEPSVGVSILRSLREPCTVCKDDGSGNCRKCGKPTRKP